MYIIYIYILYVWSLLSTLPLDPRQNFRSYSAIWLGASTWTLGADGWVTQWFGGHHAATSAWVECPAFDKLRPISCSSWIWSTCPRYLPNLQIGASENQMLQSKLVWPHEIHCGVQIGWKFASVKKRDLSVKGGPMTVKGPWKTWTLRPWKFVKNVNTFWMCVQTCMWQLACPRFTSCAYVLQLLGFRAGCRIRARHVP